MPIAPPPPACPAQEEIAAKSARLQRVAAATETARQQAAGLAAECQAERERLLEDIRRLNAQMKQKVGVVWWVVKPSNGRAMPLWAGDGTVQGHLSHAACLPVGQLLAPHSAFPTPPSRTSSSPPSSRPSTSSSS